VTNPRQRALYELTKLFVKSQNPSVSGRALRARLSGIAPTLDEQRVLAASLAPDLAEHNISNASDDWFRPTLDGLLEGYPPTAAIVALTLQFFREKAKREPDFRSFTWGELRKSFERNLDSPEDADDYPQVAVIHVLDVAGLSSAWYGTNWGVPSDIETLLEVRDVAELILKRSMTAPSTTASPVSPSKSQGKSMVVQKIFIGHGQSTAWRELKDFVQDRLKLIPEEFNSQSVAGKTTQARLQEMLDNCSFALLVLTGEDDGPDGVKSARPNVVHELGLFQGKLGFERAIVLLEDGCAEFSNIVGLTQIRFPKGKISAAFEEIRKVLEREQIIR
jgi:hypothetical protein